MESTNLLPLDGDMSRITRKAEEFKEYHDALQRNLQTYLTLAMDALSGVHLKTKASLIPDSARQMVRNAPFPFLQIHSFLLVDPWRVEKEVEISYGFRRDIEVSHVVGCLLVPCETRCRNSFVNAGTRQARGVDNSLLLNFILATISARHFQKMAVTLHFEHE